MQSDRRFVALSRYPDTIVVGRWGLTIAQAVGAAALLVSRQGRESECALTRMFLQLSDSNISVFIYLLQPQANHKVCCFCK